MKWVTLACATMLVPLLVFYTMAAAGSSAWQEVYYVWDKGKDCTLFFVLQKLAWKNYGFPLRVVLAFTIIRFIWHIITVTFGVSINHPVAINILFIILVAACTLLMIKEVIKRWRNSK